MHPDRPAAPGGEAATALLARLREARGFRGACHVLVGRRLEALAKILGKLALLDLLEDHELDGRRRELVALGVDLGVLRQQALQLGVL